MTKERGMSKQRTGLNLIALESRDQPAVFGVTWPDPMHLSLSFVPDGTQAGGISSRINAMLDAQMPRDVWRNAIVRAAQKWSEVANVNIAVVADNGAPFGSSGPMQGDPRFGDIRIGAMPMADDALATGTPPDPILAGTFSGDIVLNSNRAFTATSLYSVALHEIGHALGLAPSTNPLSVMYNTYGTRTSLAAIDVASIRALYGIRAADPNDTRSNNAIFARATKLDPPSGFIGETPLIGFGDLTNLTDVDVFSFQNLPGSSGPVTIHFQTKGVSTLNARVMVYDQFGRLLTSGSTVGNEGGTLDLTIANTLPGKKYYVRIDDAISGPHRIGRYGFGVMFDNFVELTAWDLSTVLTGPYDRMSQDDLTDLLENPGQSYLDNENDLDNNDPLEARDLDSLPSRIPDSRYAIISSLSTSIDADIYRIRAPRSATHQPQVLTVSVRSAGINGVIPQLQVFDRDLNLLSVNTLVNTGDKFIAQIPGLEQRRRFHLVLANPSGSTGNYALEAHFGTVEKTLPSFASGSISSTAPIDYKMYIAQTQLLGLALSVEGLAGIVNVRVTSASTGLVVFQLNAASGSTTTGLAAFLAPGEYDVQITTTSAVPLPFSLKGATESDPIGPQPSNSTLKPIYLDPTTPGRYLYPGNLASFDPFKFVLVLI
jgi:Matrixin